MSSRGRREGVEVVGVGLQKGTKGDGRDQAGVLDVGSGGAWRRPKEVSYATPYARRLL